MVKKPVFVVLVIGALMLSTAGPGYERPTAQAQFPTIFGATRAPSIDVDKKDFIYLMLSVATSPSGRPHSQIFFTWSKDRGLSWNNLPQTKNLSKSKGEAFGPSLAVTKKGVRRAHVVYHDNTPGPTQAFLISSKKKKNFQKPVNFTPHEGGAFWPRIALDSNEGLHIVWGDLDEGVRKVAYTRSTDLGLTFSESVIISNPSDSAFEPEVAVDRSDGINVVWEDADSGISTIMFCRSTDGGDTFSEPKALSSGETWATEPHISSDRESRLHVVWVEETENGVQAFHTRSLDEGETFSEPLRLSGFNDAVISRPVATNFKDTVWVAFQDDLQQNGQVFLVRSNNAGESFNNPFLVSFADNSVRLGRGHSPAMVSDSKGMLHIVWIDSSIVGDDEGLLFYARTTDGRNFTPAQLILAAIR